MIPSASKKHPRAKSEALVASGSKEWRWQVKDVLCLVVVVLGLHAASTRQVGRVSSHLFRSVSLSLPLSLSRAEMKTTRRRRNVGEKEAEKEEDLLEVH